MSATTKKALTDSRVAAQGRESVETEISQVGIGAMGMVSALIGLWAVACMIGGVVESGGPFSFVKSWFSAVMGG
jgi:hypothetical protein